MPEFFSRLNYTFGNEDWTTEQEALELKPNDRVLCVTGSGDRPLHLLLKDCKEIVAIDANSAQNHLLHLKMAAMKALPYEEYLSFLGAIPSTNKMKHFSKIKESMPQDSAKFWQNSHPVLSRGILYEGKMERRMIWLSKIAKCIQGKKHIKALFDCKDMDSQRRYLKTNWRPSIWRTVFDLGLKPSLSKVFLRDPGLYAHVDPSINPGHHIFDRLYGCMQNSLARENYFLSFWLKGYVERCAFPPYLMPEGIATIAPRLNRITTRSENLIDYLEAAPSNSFDCFSISDVISYIDAGSFTRLMHQIKRTAKPGARFCLREFLSRREIPKELKPHFRRNPLLEEKLEAQDCCFVYRFMVGNIHH